MIYSNGINTDYRISESFGKYNKVNLRSDIAE